jgi:RNA polymerase sigma-70 factor (ECF subfamily)
MTALAQDVIDRVIDRCLSGDARAWADLDRIYRPQALRFLRRLGVNPRDADDACQEVFVQIVRYLPRFERRADLGTWIYKLCISQAARGRRRRALLWPLALMGLAEPSLPPEWSDSRAAGLAERALAALGPRHRAIFVLYELEDLSTAEIAATLDAPPATVRRQLQEARARFEAFVREEAL